MTISYPLSLPSATGRARMKLRARNVVSVSESPFTGQQQIQQHTGQWWETEVALRPMKREDAEAWVAFLLSLFGPVGTFLMGDPAGVTARGIATGTPLVNGASQTGNSLITDGWTISTTGILKAGDYLQLGTGTTTRLYKVMQDVNSDGTGNATLDIWPRLRESPADNAAIMVSNCVGAFRLDHPETDIDIDTAMIYGLSFRAREAI